MNAKRIKLAVGLLVGVVVVLIGGSIFPGLNRCHACDCMVYSADSTLTPNLELSEFPSSITLDPALKDAFLKTKGTIQSYAYDNRPEGILFGSYESDNLYIYFKRKQ